MRLRGRRSTSVVLALALVLPAPAASAAGDESISRQTLRNGLTVLVRPNAAADVVAVSLQVRAGSLFETAETAGITNFLQRAMLRGTAKRSARQLAEAAEEIGGSVDSTGEVEYGEIRGEALARHWEKLLGLVGEIAFEATLPPQEVEKERRLLISQLQTRLDVPLQRALETMLAELYGSHPYAWPAAGRREVLERLTREALLAHYKTIYRPHRLMLAVSGNVPRDRMLAVAERLLGRVPPAPTAGPPPAAATGGRPVPPAPPGASARRRVIEGSAQQQTQILVGFVTPALGESDYPAVRVLGAVLGGGISSRLFSELRERRGLAYSIGVVSPLRSESSFLAAYIVTGPATADAAEAGLLGEIERLRAEPVSEPEVTRAKAYVLGNLAMDRRTNARHAWYLAFFETIGAGWQFPRRYASALDTVTVADVTAAAQRYLSRPTIVVLRSPPSSGTR
jgi:zinc protease